MKKMALMAALAVVLLAAGSASAMMDEYINVSGTATVHSPPPAPPEIPSGGGGGGHGCSLENETCYSDYDCCASKNLTCSLNISTGFLYVCIPKNFTKPVPPEPISVNYTKPYEPQPEENITWNITCTPDAYPFVCPDGSVIQECTCVNGVADCVGNPLDWCPAETAPDYTLLLIPGIGIPVALILVYLNRKRKGG